MKYFVFLAAAIFLCACAAAPKARADAQKTFLVESFYTQSAGGKQILSRQPLSADNGLIMLGDNLILRLAEADDNFIALHLSLINPANAKEDFVFDAPSRINLSAIEGGREWLLNFLTPDNAPAAKTRALLGPVRLAPGQAKAGVLFAPNARAPKYRLTIINNDEFFEFIFTPPQDNKDNKK